MFRFQPIEKISDAVVAQAAGMVQYRTDKNGNIMAGIGKGSFDKVSIVKEEILFISNTFIL